MSESRNEPQTGDHSNEHVGQTNTNITSSMSMSTTSIEKLNGLDNWINWKFAIKMVLTLEGLWNCVLGTDTDATRDSRALARICLSCQPSLYQIVREAKTAKDAWRLLSDTFEDKGLYRRVLLLRQLHRVEYSQYSSMSEYIESVLKLVTQLSDIGKTIDDEEIAEILLSGLPEEYNVLVSSLETASLTNTLSSEVVRTRLLQEYHRRHNGNNSSDNLAYVASRRKKSTLICTYCQKNGHAASRCFKKKREQAKKKEVEHTMYASAYSASHSKEFIVDSGATSHMCGDPTLVQEAVKKKCVISVANGQQLNSELIGRCGAGSPCEQLCRELHDGTFECGCAPGFVLHVDGYGCLELNSTKPSENSLDTEEDVLYQKDVSFSAELEVAPSSTRLKPTLRPVEKPTIRAEELRKRNNKYTAERSKEVDGLKSLIEDGVSKNDLTIIADDNIKNGLLEASQGVTTQGPSLEQKVPEATVSPPWTAAVESCNCAPCDGARCSCPFTPSKCRQDAKISTPRFSGNSWLALRALRGAYKRVRVRLRVRPARARGVLLLTGEHDDLSGDYLALLLRNGHVELRFDCGSGAGVLRSPEPVRLGRWNVISVYRHRWDAWLRLNNGKRVRGRSKGLFSRMTFREPVWVGGGGNTTGLQSKLGLADGLLGCVDFLRINGDTYRLVKDAVATLDIGECAPTLAPWQPSETTSEAANSHHIYDINDIVHFEDNDLVMRDSKAKDHNQLDNSIEFKSDSGKDQLVYKTNALDLRHSKDLHDSNLQDSKGLEFKPLEKSCECQHGGGCVGGVCLCPLGYAGARCEITLDLKVPRFNGSSYLRLPGLGNSAQSWLDIQITLKPSSGDGLVLYNSEHASGDGDFFSLHLRDYYVEFAFDLGSGIALVRSAYPLSPDSWHRVSVSRAGRRAALRVRATSPRDVTDATRSVTSHGAARRLTLRQPMLLGGAPHPLPPRLALHSSFSGCVRQLVINDEELSVVAAALGGVNVDNCEEPRNDTCAEKLCKESIAHVPYPANVSENEIHHTIVPKKGLKPKFHKIKQKKHTLHHTEKVKKKYFKKHEYLKERSNDVVTGEPLYDGQTYMQVKYLDASEINWGDTNTYPSFSGKDSFIHIDDEETMKRLLSYTLDINIRFRSEAPSGLLVWSGRAARPPGDFLSLAIEDSVLVLRYDLGSGEVVIIANHTKVDDGLWHRARATRNRQAGVLEVDGLGSVGKISPGKLKQLNTENGLYIGGLPSIEMNSMGKYKSGLVGCVSQISLSGDFDIPLSLSKLPHTITNNVGRCTP